MSYEKVNLKVTLSRADLKNIFFYFATTEYYTSDDHDL